MMVPARSLLKLSALCGIATILAAPASLSAQDVLGPSLRPAVIAPPGMKDPMTARVLGIVPGLGHLYAGEPGRAGLVAGAFVGFVLLGVSAAFGDCLQAYTEPDCGSSVLVDVLIPTAMIGTVVFSVWDAGRAAHRTNARRGLPGRLTLGGSPDGRRLRVGMAIGI